MLRPSTCYLIVSLVLSMGLFYQTDTYVIRRPSNMDGRRICGTQIYNTGFKICCNGTVRQVVIRRNPGDVYDPCSGPVVPHVIHCTAG
ncbi:hypothetical protein NP493_580g00058 [Ridgeia piscesae]|uniref:Uncharacterized protein n=1 Tax=Ridgeia piscesae TaxID=27915 RepID=A0AAD9KUQ6_RIDPI|nr:hypothetical protein NP493_580g00058 [Ridgeia piscesae]